MRRASWGNAGSGWTWFDGGTVNINANGPTTLTLNLTNVANLGNLREIGVEFHSPANSSSQTAIYVDNVATQ